MAQPAKRRRRSTRLRDRGVFTDGAAHAGHLGPVPAAAPAPNTPASLAAIASLEAEMEPMAAQESALKRKRDELERQNERDDEELDEEGAALERKYNAERAQLQRKRAKLLRKQQGSKNELEREQAELESRMAPVRRELDETAGYLRLVRIEPSTVPADLPADAPPTILLAAQRRLGVAGIGSARLGAGSMLSSDVAEMVAHHVRGFDHFGEQEKVAEHGEAAAAARLQFRPPLPAAGQKPEATGFLLEGCPQQSFDGVYRLDSEHEGWPVLKNANGRCCYRDENDWVLGNKHRPSEDLCAACIVATQGPMPVGSRKWLVVDDDWVYRPVTVTLLPSEAAVKAAERRHNEALAAELAARAAVARAQLESVREVIVAGCQQPEWNGSYAPRPAHEGWPRFENEHGRHLYYYAPDQQWSVNDRFAPDVDESMMFLDSSDGSLPLGLREWCLSTPDKTEYAGSDQPVSVSLQT